MNVMVRYNNNTVMNYCLYAHAPWEGYRVCFNGTKGRLEFNIVENPYVETDIVEDFATPGMRELMVDKKTMVPEIIFQPLWGKPVEFTYEVTTKSGHGGGDIRLLDHIFRGSENDPLGHAAGYLDGAKSILTGIAANISMKTGLPVNVKDLVQL